MATIAAQGSAQSHAAVAASGLSRDACAPAFPRCEATVASEATLAMRRL